MSPIFFLPCALPGVFHDSLKAFDCLKYALPRHWSIQPIALRIQRHRRRRDGARKTAFAAQIKILAQVLSIISNRKNDDLKNLKSTQRAPTFVLHSSSIINRTSKNPNTEIEYCLPLETQ
jgi:hypothetical protein